MIIKHKIIFMTIMRLQDNYYEFIIIYTMCILLDFFMHKNILFQILKNSYFETIATLT